MSRCTKVAWLVAWLVVATPASAQPSEHDTAELARALTEARAVRGWHRRLPAPELDDWVDPRTGSSTRTAVGCKGLVVEATLSGDRRRNYVSLALFNASNERMRLSHAIASARFGDGALRKLAHAVELELEPEELFARDLAFRDKEVFEDQRTLELTVRVLSSGGGTSCVVALTFERFSEGQDLASYTPYSTFELDFGLGVRAAETGGLSALQGGSRVSFHLDFGGYFDPHHGVSLTLLIDEFGSGAADDVTPRALGGDPRVSASGFLAGYIGRIHLAPWLTAAYNVASGPYIFEVNDAFEGARLSTAVFPLRQRVRAIARLVPIGEDWIGLGGSLSHLIVFNGELGAIELSGQTFTAMFELSVTH